MRHRRGWRQRAAAWGAAWFTAVSGAWPWPWQARAQGAPPPSVPPGGGDWTAHLAPDGSWRLRASAETAWLHLDPRGFHAFRAQVAAAGGCMLTIEDEPGGQDGAVHVRRRTRGYWLDGDTREAPAVLRRRAGCVEYHFYRRGNPLGYERLGAPAAGAPLPDPTLPGIARAA